MKFFLLFMFLCTFLNADGQRPGSTNPSLVVVIEGLRPEFVNRSLMPNLYGLSKKGVRLESHHAVFPPLPTVNAASISTGSYPRNHGILGNPNTDVQGMTAQTIGEIVAASKKKLLVLSAASEELTSLIDAKSGKTAPSDLSISERNSWVVDAYLEEPTTPDIRILWLDTVEAGPSTNPSEIVNQYKEIDVHIGRIAKYHRKQKINLLVTSSEGEINSAALVRKTPKSKPVYRNRQSIITDFLIQKGLKETSDSDDVSVVNGTFIFVKDSNLTQIRKIVAQLQRNDLVGAVLTQQIRKTHPEGKALGALSFQSVFIDHDRAPDILIEHEPGNNPLLIPLIAMGPNIKSKRQSAVPAANSDLAPTLLFLSGIDVPDSMTGRVLHEILAEGPGPEDVEVLKRRSGAQVDLGDFTYRLFMTEYTVDGVDYLHELTPQRIPKN
jgi:hypothetical protein